MKALLFSLFMIWVAPVFAGQEKACDESEDILTPACVQELGLEEQLSRVKTELQSAATDAKISCPPVYVVRVTDRCNGDPACVLGIPQLEGYSVVNIPVLFVSMEFLTRSSPTKLRHMTYHEACHIKNKDVGAPRTDESETERQMRTEQCVFDLAGEDRYIEFAREWNSSLEDDQLRQAIRGVFGKKE